MNAPQGQKAADFAPEFGEGIGTGLLGPKDALELGHDSWRALRLKSAQLGEDRHGKKRY
jgi:hypothetical protein